MRPELRRCAAVAAVGALLGIACPVEGDAGPGLDISVRAREIAPGEPLRVLVRSAAPLERLGGTFLGQPVHLTRTSATAEGELWSGWTMIDLEQAPGPAAIELSGTRRSGAAVAGTHAITVRAKEFPEERLSVSSSYVRPPPEVEERLERERARTAEIYRTLSAAAPPAGAFVRPVPGEATSIFGTRRLFNGEPRSPHPGLDLRAATGTAVRSAGGGAVALAADLYYSGGTVIVDHGGGLFTIYAHLSRIDVDEGQSVAAGAQLGLSGATGRVTGPHLHWGAKIGDRPFDPTALLDPALF